MISLSESFTCSAGVSRGRAEVGVTMGCETRDDAPARAFGARPRVGAAAAPAGAAMQPYTAARASLAKLTHVAQTARP